MRKTFIDTLVKEAKKDERIFLVCPDIGYSVLEVFRDQFPNRFLNVGVAEQNAISIAAGLALTGYIPFVYTIMPFVVMRPFEQIRIDVAYMNTNVRIVGVGAGFSYGAAGATHHSLEDIAIMRVLPGMTVICPGDPWEVQQSVKASINYKGPVYFRLGKQGEPILNDKTSSYQIGKATLIRNGDHVHLISTSNTLEISCKVAEALSSQNINCSVTSMHTMKPFDVNYINSLLETCKPIFTIEEHYIVGGLGSAVSEVIAESKFNPLFKRFGVNDQFSHYVGGQDFIRDKFGINTEIITQEILELLKKEK
ncbi:MAG: transketolase subunit [Ferruginibacter sp.]|nr:transketolase subunit [Ferruginibacter sp.]